jgi:hypothetical protein
LNFRFIGWIFRIFVNFFDLWDAVDFQDFHWNFRAGHLVYCPNIININININNNINININSRLSG